MAEAFYINNQGEIGCLATLPNGDMHVALLVPAGLTARQGLPGTPATRPASTIQQAAGRASDQAVEVVGRPVFPQHRGQGVAVAVGVVSDGLAPRVDYIGVAAGGAAGGRKVPHGAVRPEEPVVCLVAYEVDSEPSGCRS